MPTNTQTNKTVPAYLSVTDFASRIGVHPATVRTWDRNGCLRPHHRTPGGKGFYSEDQVKAYFPQSEEERRRNGYAPVSIPNKDTVSSDRS